MDVQSSSWCRRMLPPYFKYAVFLLSGFELVFSCLVLSIAEAYYKSASLLLPISYRIFDDTVKKGLKDFAWDEEAKSSLELYKTKMMTVWAVCTVTVLVCMLIIIPQFFDFNDAKGNPSHLCIVRRRLGWILFSIQAIVCVVLGASLIWAWIGCRQTVTLFYTLFDVSHKEEVFLSELENKLDCSTDDDKEVAAAHHCEHNVKTSFIPKWWMDTIVLAYFIGHLLIFLITPFFNRQLIKPDDDEYTQDQLLDS